MLELAFTSFCNTCVNSVALGSRPSACSCFHTSYVVGETVGKFAMFVGEVVAWFVGSKDGVKVVRAGDDDCVGEVVGFPVTFREGF